MVFSYLYASTLIQATNSSPGVGPSVYSPFIIKISVLSLATYMVIVIVWSRYLPIDVMRFTLVTSKT